METAALTLFQNVIEAFSQPKSEWYKEILFPFWLRIFFYQMLHLVVTAKLGISPIILQKKNQ